MTVPLMILMVFAIAAGWIGIPSDFLGLKLPENWFHGFVGSTLAVHPEAVPFNFVPLLTSVGVASLGLFLGWWVYRRQQAGAPDPLQKPLGPIYTVLKNKYYFDELYDWAFVRPAYWIAETFTNQWMDRGVIDGFLHIVARTAGRIGGFFRNKIDKPVVNGFGDFIGEGAKKLGRSLRFIQTGRVQQYLLAATILAFGTLFYFIYSLLRP
jgi:NADH-quinone oxidoreductase subunit L